MFNHVVPYGYLLPIVYLFMADIANPDLFVCGCRAWICLDITHFYEEQRQPSSGSAWPACPKNDKSGTHCWSRREVYTQFAQQFVTTVTATPLIDCVVWSLLSFCLSMCFWYQWSFRQNGQLNTVSCMLHIGSLIRL